eukprot:CAMPEP_0180039306 /NCGR_PEP_ID=MMETSP0984-20121128/32772_1 /TAXON_ID=483367 /ORGANISM="non described non described, Strain CCMP 2436" /LENGTH=104 /DNA_ID=CAMNT_0021966303 /DNA_START=6 /DNA_END=320 /DNA_ORIENTATION=-
MSWHTGVVTATTASADDIVQECGERVTDREGEKARRALHAEERGGESRLVHRAADVEHKVDDGQVGHHHPSVHPLGDVREPERGDRAVRQATKRTQLGWPELAR